MKHLKFVVFLLAVATVFSCDTQKDDYAIEYGYEYYPLDIGKYWVYRVDSILFDTINLSTTIDTSVTFVKEEITDTIHDQTGNILYKIERFERKADTLTWEVKNVWTAGLYDSKAFKTEGNFKFIKMVFPVKENKYWDGNVYFDERTIIFIKGESIEMFKGWDYFIESVGQSENIGDTSYDEVTTIYQADAENLIELRYSMEKYAKNVGLVYREMKILDSQSITESIPWEEKAQKGFILRQVLLEFN